MTIAGRLIFKGVPNKIIWTSKRKRMDSNRKMDRLISYSPSILPNYNITVINFSTTHSTQKQLNQLKIGLDYSFVDENKYVKMNIAASMESLAEAVVKGLDNEKREDFHEHLLSYTNILSKNLFFKRLHIEQLNQR